MNDEGYSGKKVEDKATSFSKMLIIFYQNGHRQIPEDRILLSANQNFNSYLRKEE